MIRWLMDNLSTLALSFILALFVWFVALRETNPIVEKPFAKSVPIEMLNQPTGTTLTNVSDRSIDVVVRGPEQEIDRLGIDNLRAFINLSVIELGGASVPVAVTVDNPLVTVVEQSVHEVFVQLEEYRRVTLSVVAQISGEPALGHIAGDPVVEPTEVTVEGPASKVAPVTGAFAEMYVQGARETVKRKITVRLGDADNHLIVGVNPNPAEVWVTVPVTKSDEYAELEVTINLSGSVASGYRPAGISVEPERVVIRGRPEVLSSLPGFINTDIVDLTGTEGDVVKRVGLQVPPGVSLVGAQTVEVTIDVEPVMITISIPWRLRIQGPDPGLTATLSLDTVNVGLVGPLALINSFDPERDLELTINLYGLAPGTRQVPVVGVSRLTGVEVLDLLPPAVQVEIGTLPTPTPTPTAPITITATVTNGVAGPDGTPAPATTTVPGPTPTPVLTPRP